MRVLWHSAPPDMPTGYAQQSGLIIPRLAAMGHQIAISATAGQESHAGKWREFPVFPKTPYADFGEDVVGGHAKAWDADLIVTFLCTWILNPMAWRDHRVLHLTPVDCEPMSVRDYSVIADSGGMPAAVSRFGVEQMKARGLDPLYLPHGVDTSVFRPPADRIKMRRKLNLDDKFVVGMNFMNNDKFRKNIPEQMRAFAEFHRRVPNSVLAIHAIAILPEGYNLPALAAHLGISDAVLFSDQYQLVTGGCTPEMLAAWYGTCDVVLECGNEGFGLCRLEAQACGTPVITGKWGTGPELNAFSAWTVLGEKFYNDVHRADWHRPYVASIKSKLRQVHHRWETGTLGRAEACAFVKACYDIDQIVKEHWGPALDELT